MTTLTGTSAANVADELAPDVQARWLVVITVLALVARLVQLDSGLWVDEIYMLARSVRLDLGTIITSYRGDTHHPLYAVLSHLSWAAFGESSWSIRLPAVIAGVLAVPVTFWLAKRVIPGREALAVVLLLAVSYHHVWFSQNARGYTLMALFATASTWALLRALDTGTFRYFAWHAVFSALGAYTHLTMIFVTVAHALVVGAALLWPEPGRPRVDWRLPFASFAMAAIITVALYAPAMDEVLNFFLNKPSELRGVSTPAWAAAEAFRSMLVGLGGPRVALGAVVLATAALVGIAGFASIARRDRSAALCFSLPVATTLGGALLGRGTLYPRFFFFLAGIILIVFVHGVVVSTDWLASRLAPSQPDAGRWVAWAGIGVIAAASVAALSYNYRYPKQDFEGAMRFVERERAPADRVAFAGAGGRPYSDLYGLDWPTITSDAALAELRRGARTWLVYTFPRYLAANSPELAAIVRNECRSPERFRGTLGGGDIFVCRLEAAS